MSQTATQVANARLQLDDLPVGQPHRASRYPNLGASNRD
jgi:hypothetical protein